METGLFIANNPCDPSKSVFLFLGAFRVFGGLYFGFFSGFGGKKLNPC